MKKIYAREITLQLPHIKLRARSWGKPDGQPILALHGWLDNAASFDFLAVQLLARQPHLQIIALDLPGHGRSEHYPGKYGHLFIDYVSTIMEVFDNLGWQKAILLGHSMGAAIGTLVSGAFPEHVSHLILIDAIGPIPEEAKNAPARYRSYYEQLTQLGARKKNGLNTYSSLKSLVRARQRKNQISTTSALLLLKRSMEKQAHGYSFRNDPMLSLTSKLRMTNEHVLAFVEEVRASTLLLIAKEGIYSAYEELMEKCIQLYQKIQVHRDLAGGHHLHMEEATMTAKLIDQWLLKNK